jgi:hypothetical protein
MKRGGYLRKLIALGALNGTVEDEDVSKSLGLKDQYVLEEGCFDMKNFVDLDSHGLSWPLVRDLVKPAICFVCSTIGSSERGGTKGLAYDGGMCEGSHERKNFAADDLIGWLCSSNRTGSNIK